MDNAPFLIGQKVVSLKSCVNDVGIGITKGQVFTILKLHQCKVCKQWSADVGLICNELGANHHINDHRINISRIALVACSILAPIIKNNQYADITKELAKLPEDTPEVDVIPKKIVEPAN